MTYFQTLISVLVVTYLLGTLSSCSSEITRTKPKPYTENPSPTSEDGTAVRPDGSDDSSTSDETASGSGDESSPDGEIRTKMGPYVYDAAKFPEDKYCVATLINDNETKDLFGRELDKITAGTKLLVADNDPDKTDMLLVFMTSKGATNFNLNKADVELTDCTNDSTNLNVYAIEETPLYTDKETTMESCKVKAGDLGEVTKFGYEVTFGSTSASAKLELSEASCGDAVLYGKITKESLWTIPVIGIRSIR